MTKRWWIRGLEGYVLTDYARHEKHRRRRIGKAAKQARKRNRK